MSHPLVPQLDSFVATVRRSPMLSVGLGVVLLCIALVSIAIALGWYPIMLVDGTAVSAMRFEKNYRAAVMYYENLRRSTAGNASATLQFAEMSPADIQVAVLDQMVAAALVQDGARRETGEELPTMVRDKVAAALADSGVANGVGLLYGMTIEDFRDEVLVPQAEREILDGRLFWRGEAVESWLADARKNTKVQIFSPKFSWDGGKVVAN